MKSRTRIRQSLILVLSYTLLFCTNTFLGGQISSGMLTGAALNGIQTSVPFLTIAPDGRSTGMGDAGVASCPDANSQHWNAGKYAFMKGKRGVSMTYAPWLTTLMPDIYHLYFTGYYRIDHKNTISSSLRYFSLGTTYFSGVGVPTADFHPKEFAVDVGFSRKFTDHFSGGVALRYIYSDLFDGNTAVSGQDTHVGTSLAGDLGLYYQNHFQVKEKEAQWALGLNISNIGGPISYTETDKGTPLPTNLRLGGRFTFNFNEKNSLSLNADMNKLLVPSTPVYEQDSTTEELIIVRGKEAPESVLAAMLQSFYDAPGIPREDGSYSVISEEFQEISFALGAEYWYRKLIAFRSGYFHEHPAKGNRNNFTFGLGARYRFMSFDLSYLLPLQGQNSPLYNTFRFSLIAQF